MYDLIGDIHGYASALESLLHKLGYRDHAGTWQHPERKVIFLGDFVDRGPEQGETVRIARCMVEAGHALAVMGNHEFNAVAWATPHEGLAGSFLRSHSEKNRVQHQAFLAQVGENSEQHQQTIEWFRTLPLYLDIKGLRVIHACWHPRHIEALAEYLDEQARILPGAWQAVCNEGTEAFEAVEVLLKGMEIPLPVGVRFKDKDGHSRSSTRTRWWQEGAQLTYRDLAMVSPAVIEQLPHEPIPADLQPGYDGAKPLFIGHYWMRGTPTLLTDQIACLDYSIASADPRHAKLCAYRWSGEAILLEKNLVWVGRSA
ncbi:metallophosphoesterase [Pseudomonas mangrovi]|uniref:Metallophosphoesterase n=1 Tax=Pseudomonas mangrovi TaxID=2161748 RepID=A0A2T5PBT9_9PSED|nr:metallophosphoesterase [Pseudomonas mangrovi]PTU75218.1 metallophosphoesterase [Pseudomonas mangrovi]